MVDPSAHGQWYDFFTSKFLPSISDRRVVFCRVLAEQSDAHYTYSLQIDAVDIVDYQTIERDVIGPCVDHCRAMFDDRVLHFSTLLKKIGR